LNQQTARAAQRGITLVRLEKLPFASLEASSSALRDPVSNSEKHGEIATRPLLP
jgi:hypothetical protein